MYSGRFMFSQLMDHLPMKTFRRCVQRYPGWPCLESHACDVLGNADALSTVSSTPPAGLAPARSTRPPIHRTPPLAHLRDPGRRCDRLTAQRPSFAPVAFTPHAPNDTLRSAYAHPRAVRALLSREAHPSRDDALGFEAVAQLVQGHRLVLQRPPEPFDEHVVQTPPAAIHRTPRPARENPFGERHGGELRPLVGVEDLRRSVAKGRLERLDAQLAVHSVRQIDIHNASTPARSCWPRGRALVAVRGSRSVYADHSCSSGLASLRNSQSRTHGLHREIGYRFPRQPVDGRRPSSRSRASTSSMIRGTTFPLTPLSRPS